MSGRHSELSILESSSFCSDAIGSVFMFAISIAFGSVLIFVLDGNSVRLLTNICSCSSIGSDLMFVINVASASIFGVTISSVWLKSKAFLKNQFVLLPIATL